MLKRLPMRKQSKSKSAPPFLLASITGIQYWVTSKADLRALQRRLKTGLKLRIFREPKNKHDRYACAVYVGKKQVGYFPRYDARQIAPLIDSGQPYKFYLHEFERNGPIIYWNTLRVIGIRQCDSIT
ncbi:MAG TPA: hypothetical protein DCS07_00795 [Bdellovibrionales bacterium]|nr:hypothetical protein [Bdellovibrionales bacterium]